MKMNGNEEGYEKVFSDALFKTIIGKVGGGSMCKINPVQASPLGSS